MEKDWLKEPVIIKGTQIGFCVNIETHENVTAVFHTVTGLSP